MFRGVWVIPQAKAIPVAAFGVALAVADVVTLNGFLSVVGALIALVVAFFSVRNMRRSYWKSIVEERDDEVRELRREADEKLQERAAFAEEQRELRHNLKNRVAALEGQLSLEQAKHDLTSLYVRLDAVEAVLSSRQGLFEAMAEGVKQQSAVLGEILEELRNRPEQGRRTS